MSVQNVPNLNMSPKVVSSPANGIPNGSMVRVYDVQKKASNKVKIGVFCTTLMGVLASMAWTFKAHKLPLNNFFKNMATIKYNEENNELPKLVGRLAIGSIGGGLVGGAIFDKKENFKAKLREAVIQGIGNIATPLGCVGLGITAFKKHVSPKLIEKFNLNTKLKQGIPEAIASAGLLVGAIFAGNKIGNFINEKIFHVNDNRKLKLSDMSPHVDDACFAFSLVAPENAFGDMIKRIIPAALMVAGFSTGIAQENGQEKH